MAEISPYQETESQWIEALLFLPISEILSLTWEIVVKPSLYSSESSGQQELESTYITSVPM
jgi:hypothetical protein